MAIRENLVRTRKVAASLRQQLHAIEPHYPEGLFREVEVAKKGKK